MSSVNNTSGPQGSPIIVVELFGLPRLWAGCAEVAVPAATVAHALAALELHCPRLQGLRQADGSLAPQFLLSLNGTLFVRDVQQPLQAGDRLLLLSADAGG